MHGDSSRRTAQVSRSLDTSESEVPDWPASDKDTQPWGEDSESHDDGGARARLARLARAIECDVIPRLLEAHRPARGTKLALLPAIVVQDEDVHAFVLALEGNNEGQLSELLHLLRQRGASVESIYIDLFTPAARQLGDMWSEDLCDFSTVTVALGHLQRLLRELNPDLNAEQEEAACGHRILFVQPKGEQHSFGLSMLAEFFRRDGWTVLGGVGTATTDPENKVRGEWVDVLGYSVGADRHIEWLVDSIRLSRAASRNPELVVLVGGPLFIARPELVSQVGADGTATDPRSAPAVSERLVIGSKRRSK